MIRWLSDPMARFRGRLEGISDQRLHGWAIDRRAPQVRQIVCLTELDGPQVEAVADLYRADLHQNRIGDGHYGFSLPISRLAEASIVHATIRGCDRPLIGSPVSCAHVGSARRSVRTGMLVQIDEASDPNILTGWIVDLAQTLRRPSVALRQRGRVIARDRATRFRQDIDIASCDALHGFRLTWSGLRPDRCELIDTRGDRLLANVRMGR